MLGGASKPLLWRSNIISFEGAYEIEEGLSQIIFAQNS
jgi:hypothetical protein